MNNHEMAEWLANLLVKASDATTPEAKARVLWRASDIMWTQIGKLNGFALPRAFNNLLQEKELPWIDGLFSKEEREAMFRRQFSLNA